MAAEAISSDGNNAQILVVRIMLLALLLACGKGAPTAPSTAPAPDAGPGWVVLYREDFESLAAPRATWQADTFPDDGPYSDNGAYFHAKGIVPPKAFRATVPFGTSGWLTAESYTRSDGAAFAERFAVVADPASPKNHVLRIASPAHTDATVIRPSQPLPARYRISLRIGFADFGDGVALNGYKGGETAEPWLPDDATTQNGFYWLAILDSMPRPHNNVWIHHHRKVVLDSDNNVPPWMEIWDGAAFHPDGRHPLMSTAARRLTARPSTRAAPSTPRASPTGSCSATRTRTSTSAACSTTTCSSRCGDSAQPSIVAER